MKSFSEKSLKYLRSLLRKETKIFSKKSSKSSLRRAHRNIRGLLEEKVKVHFIEALKVYPQSKGQGFLTENVKIFLKKRALREEGVLIEEFKVFSEKNTRFEEGIFENRTQGLIVISD